MKKKLKKNEKIEKNKNSTDNDQPGLLNESAFPEIQDCIIIKFKNNPS